MQDKSYQKALRVLKQGGVIVFPCDTVMGIGCAMDKPEAIDRMYKIKRRPKDQPTAILVSDIGMAGSLMAEKPDEFLEKVMEKYWPGGLTIIVQAASIVPRSVTGGTPGVGIRIPDFPKLQKLIKKMEVPLVATSANFRGDSPPVKFKEIRKDFLSLIDYAIEEDSGGPKASTVVRYLGNSKFEYLREGEVEPDGVSTVRTASPPSGLRRLDESVYRRMCLLRRAKDRPD